jgi:4-amino-4-deoxy-L-arabinose transferase-like glycosyltransferase
MLIEEPTGVRARARVGRIGSLAGLSASTWILIAITAAGAAIRFATQTSQSYWLDEAQAAHELSLSFGQMLSAWGRAEWNPPLYLIVAWPWAKVFGTGEAGVRSLSAVFGTALIPVMYLCGRELVSRRAGLIAAAFTALNPFMVWYSQEAREYMLLTLLCTGSLLFFARAVNPDRGSDVRAQRRDLAWWTVLSALAVLTQYFAGFLVLAEGLWLIWRLRSRMAVGALAVQGVVLAPFVGHVLPQLHTQAGFIVSQPLELRIKQVPITFAFNTLFKSSLVTGGLVGAAIAVAIVIALLLAGATDRQLRGAGLAAGLGAFVIVVPLLMALVGHDDFLARGLMPAWPPLAIVFAAACAAPRARLAGAALAIALLGSFVWAGLRIDSDQAFQRPDWRGVAAALGTSTQQRAVVAYPGQFATGPLSVLMARVPWAGPGESPTEGSAPGTTTELDIVANEGQTVASDLGGARLIGHRDVPPYVVDRFALPAPMPVQAPALVVRANALLAAPTPDPAVLVQAPPVG